MATVQPKSSDPSALVARILNNFQESVTITGDNAEPLAPAITAAATAMINALLSDHKILACGNGGSAADCQHFSAELLNRFESERPGHENPQPERLTRGISAARGAVRRMSL